MTLHKTFISFRVKLEKYNYNDREEYDKRKAGGKDFINLVVIGEALICPDIILTCTSMYIPYLVCKV